jgi:hypothetical protein
MPETPRPILRAAFLLIFSAIALAILPMACVEQNDDPGGGSGGGGGSDGGQQDPPTGGISFSISGDA